MDRGGERKAIGEERGDMREGEGKGRALVPPPRLVCTTPLERMKIARKNL